MRASRLENINWQILREPSVSEKYVCRLKKSMFEANPKRMEWPLTVLTSCHNGFSKFLDGAIFEVYRNVCSTGFLIT